MTASTPPALQDGTRNSAGPSPAHHQDGGTGAGDSVLLTGATGFVGGALWPVLEAAGYHVRGATRDPGRAARRWPSRTWVQADVESGAGLAASLDGCRAAFYLVHGMRGGHPDFRRREVDAAHRFAAAAAAAGLERIVYLGGVAPSGEASEHLRSRLDVGEALASGPVPSLELRASMIVGAGSISWLIVRDLAARLPTMVLPRWMRSRTQPVAIADVVAALEAGLRLPLPASASFDLPGPEALTGREIIDAAARALRLRRPVAVEVPLLTPWLSSQWVRLVTRANWEVARELVLGLSSDLLARDARYWIAIRHTRLTTFSQAAAQAIADERRVPPPAGPGRTTERLVAYLRHAT
ncbi:MAG: Putative nucleoside-diphosphate-sugar epimerase [uncultured Chloroflexi bacterium]|uniref:Nucleoside-diphosphate-sugar epimerase n=1 Tax=uncultured Chloroflexota bacterium TaxID=166587 RepID=A0A6J4HA85_9CHLR|nr:MAG: Putative nucleoside-diphosphate-sugar epimerase [uncultured Chloroflexota bacterium]